MDSFKWNSKLVAAKLRELKPTTKLQHWEHCFALFGRLDANVPPKTFVYPNGQLNGVGFGHLGSSPAQIIPPQDRRAWRTLH